MVQRSEKFDFAPDVLLAVGDAAEFALRQDLGDFEKSFSFFYV